jgi:uncharacterized membrane protein YedE/YeeE
MGPLILNDIIDPGWSYLIALFVGFAFGFVLEASGFSTARKIVGLFYGYDFTVLRVFFTATITAMLGLLYLNYMGWIDLSMIYFPPTFVNSAIFGGVMMGLGFVIGGFCPGTSLVAVGIGKLDGIVFTVGMFIGILIFGEAYPLFEEFYLATSLGQVKITETLGVPTGVFVVAFILIAIISFNLASYVKTRTSSIEY